MDGLPREALFTRIPLKGRPQPSTAWEKTSTWASRQLADSVSRTFHSLTEWGAPKLETGFWGKDKDKTKLPTLLQSREDPSAKAKATKDSLHPTPEKQTSSTKEQTEMAKCFKKNYDQTEYFSGKASVISH